MNKRKIINIIGAGLAGSEAAWQIANLGLKVNLYEMRPQIQTPAHKTDKFAELVCSNSFRSDELSSAVGLLHQEMRLCNSLILNAADACKVPAGSALAVDREEFADKITYSIKNHPNINVINEEFKEIPQDDNQITIIASGPLTSSSLSKQITQLTGEEYLAFFDAIAPIVYTESIDFNIAWHQSRYDKGDGKDYINCPLNKEQYDNLITEMLSAQKIEFKDWEQSTPYFNGCLPVEVMAERGHETLRYGPMKPVGLTNLHNPTEKPYAVVQLRQDNKLGSLHNIVGFQTKMKYGEQTRVFRMIPGLQNAEFAKLGGLHRNTFIKSPKLLANNFALKSHPNIRFAGQITGVEGYLESAAIGMLVGIITAHEIQDNTMVYSPPASTALGALANYILSDADADSFQPMNINFGLLAPLPAQQITSKMRSAERKAKKKQLLVQRALNEIENWYKNWCIK